MPDIAARRTWTTWRRRPGCWLALAAAALTILGATTAALARDPDAMLRASIEDQAAALGAAERGARVTIRVQQGQVVLLGSVRLYQQRLLYEQAAWQTAGVADVENEIRVVPVAALSDRDVEREIFALGKLNRFQGADLRVRVERGTVEVDARFHEPADVLFLRRRIAEIEGVRGITIRARFSV